MAFDNFPFDRPDVADAGQSGFVRAMYPSDCCTSCNLESGSSSPPSGWIALISRGNCTFNQKMLLAQASGASGVIVIMRPASNYTHVPNVELNY